MLDYRNVIVRFDLVLKLWNVWEVSSTKKGRYLTYRYDIEAGRVSVFTLPSVKV